MSSLAARWHAFLRQRSADQKPSPSPERTPPRIFRFAQETPGLAFFPLFARRWVFLDVEATGLRGGAGCWAFLVGVAWVDTEAGQLQIVQHVLPDLPDEPAFLEAVADTLGKAAAIVTFNGKTFDIPLLRDRFRLAGLSSWPELPHLDFLPHARRLWGSGTLAELEARVLGRSRRHDVPGAMLPSLYRAYLQGDPGALELALQHNRADLVALVEIFACWCRLVAQGPEEIRDPWVLRGLGRVYQAAHDWDLACRALELAGAWRDAAEAARRSGDWERAAQLWDRARRGSFPSAKAAVALAKFHEHHRRDLHAALAVVEEALRLPGRYRDDLLKRQMRLRKRLGLQA